MKVLIYTSDFLPLIGGGVAVVEALARGLNGQAAEPPGIEVTVVTAQGAEDFDDPCLPFRVVRRPKLPELLRTFRAADVVHLAGPSLVPLTLGLLLRKPLVIEHHGFQTICPNGQLFYEPNGMPCPGHFMAGRHWECLRCNAKQGKLTGWKWWLFTFPRRWLSRRATVNIAPTVSLDELLQLPQTITIHHGVKEGTRPVQGPSNGRIPTFAFVGRLVSTKGTHVLLQAARQLKGEGLAFRLSIVGDGPERDRLEKLAGAWSLADSVKFFGYLPDAALAKVLAEATAVIVPSLAGEVFGLVVAENMMHGRALIASDLPAFAEVLGPTGLRFPPGDSKALAGCLKQVLQSPQKAAAMGLQARERARELFRLERMVAEHLQLYRRLARNGSSSC